MSREVKQCGGSEAKSHEKWLMQFVVLCVERYDCSNVFILPCKVVREFFCMASQDTPGLNIEILFYNLA